MKAMAIISLILFISCKKGNVESKAGSSRAQVEAIGEPLFYSDTLSRGELAAGHRLTHIRRESYSWNNAFYFEYVPGTDRIRSIFYQPDSRLGSCASARCTIFYKNDKIDRMDISSGSLPCEPVVRSFQFEYFPAGALKRVFHTDTSFRINETFFSYDSTGRVSKIFQTDRYRNDLSYRFSELGFEYDSDGNVSRTTFQPSYSDTIAEETTVEYDKSVNPFRGLFIPDHFLFVYGFNESSPLFLSAKVVSKTTHRFLSNGSVQILPYTISRSNDRMDKFYYADQYGSTFYYQ